jgi:hypothetical protein
MPVCPTCRTGYMEGESHTCGTDKNWRKVSSTDVRHVQTANPASAASALSGRYRDGYRQARFISGFGQFVKIVGAGLGALVVVAGVASSSDGALGTRIAIASAIGRGVVALVFFVAGVIIAAQGQLLLASLDTAVNSSPILTDDQRARIMF